MRLVHAMDTANNVRTCDMKRVYSVYTFYYKAIISKERGSIGEHIGGK